MIIVRGNMEIELSPEELREAWHEHQSELDAQDYDRYCGIVRGELAVRNTAVSDEEVGLIADEAWKNVRKYDCDFKWVFGDGFNFIMAEALGR